MMFISKNPNGGPRKPFANSKARVGFLPCPSIPRIGCKNVRGWPVRKVWRKRHPGLLFPGLVAQGGLTGILLPLGHHCVSRSLWSPLDRARACPPPPQAGSRDPAAPSAPAGRWQHPPGLGSGFGDRRSQAITNSPGGVPVSPGPRPASDSPAAAEEGRARPGPARSTN